MNKPDIQQWLDMPDVNRAISLAQCRLERVQKLIELNAPVIIVDNECRMAAYGLLMVAHEYDKDKELQRSEKSQ